MLANFLDDGGVYANQILEGDIHQYNADAIKGTRDQAKRFIYSVLFGAGDQLVGKIVGGSAKDGKRLKDSFNEAVPAFAKLQSNLKRAAKRGYLVGLCGRKLYIREERKLLSQLLQASGAVVCKKWVQLTHTEINKQFGPEQAFLMAWVHDEVQIACKNKDIANECREIAIRMAGATGRHFNTKIRIDAEGNLGQSWLECH
jgi:DNA polymerase I-like protein with 3'-5' exonuclease and polymerase domains